LIGISRGLPDFVVVLRRKMNRFFISTLSHLRGRISPVRIPVCRAVITIGFKCGRQLASSFSHSLLR
jgi:hypothetical protein